MLSQETLSTDYILKSREFNSWSGCYRIPGLLAWVCTLANHPINNQSQLRLPSLKSI